MSNFLSEHNATRVSTRVSEKWFCFGNSRFPGGYQLQPMPW